jgi:hypothetical protein
MPSQVAVRVVALAELGPNVVKARTAAQTPMIGTAVRATAWGGVPSSSTVS